VPTGTVGILVNNRGRRTSTPTVRFAELNDHSDAPLWDLQPQAAALADDDLSLQDVPQLQEVGQPGSFPLLQKVLTSSKMGPLLACFGATRG
jgi:hypothetical protein